MLPRVMEDTAGSCWAPVRADLVEVILDSTGSVLEL